MYTVGDQQSPLRVTVVVGIVGVLANRPLYPKQANQYTVVMV